jgi:TolB-like protein
MSSIISDYEYDIFISYRQKDNKGERWVSEFVEALKTELESAFKEEISVYFDNNPHDGLLETHDVNESLKKKLKCLVFIPIISRTYCDPKSYAWEREFIAFVEQASNDKFGLKVTLPNGNVMNRVLPVRIHDLDITDLKLCESALGGVMRGVDFVYKATGVNRPLRAVEDHPHDNINKTYYRDQINKVANSIRDIIQGLQFSEMHVETEPGKKEEARVEPKGRKLFNRRILHGIILLLLLLVCISGIYIYTRVLQHNIAENTIAIIPLTNPLGDTELESHAVGSMDAIINKLQKINSLTVRGYLTSFYYLNTKKSVDELRKKLNVNYLVVLNLRKTGNEVKMSIRLTETRNDEELWTDEYDWNQEQLMPVFTKVVQTIAGKLNVNLTREDIMNMEKDLTNNPEAYGHYLTASAGLITAMGHKFPDTTGFRSAIASYDKAVEKDPDFTIAYARRAIALSWGFHNGELDSSVIEKCWSDISKASQISNDFPDVQIARGFYFYYCMRDFSNALMSFHIASEKDPENYLPRFYMAMVNKAMGNWEEVKSLLETVTPADPQDPLVLTNIGLCFQYLHKFDSALIYHQKAINVNRDWLAAYLNKFYTLLLMGKASEARSLLDSVSKNSGETYVEDQILLDMYQGEYLNALSKITNAVPADFDYNGIRSLYLANICTLLNDKANADRYFDAALDELNLELKADTGNAEIHGYIGLALAGRGNTDAVSKGENAVRIAKTNNDKILEREMILFQAEIYTKLGMFKEAVGLIEDSLMHPSLFSTKFLELDPRWKPLMKRPDIKTIIEKYAKKY